MAQGGLRVPSLLAMPEAHQHITHRDARRPSEGGRRRPVMLTRASPEVPGQCWDPTPYYGASSMTGPRGSTPACWRQVGALAAEAWSGWGASGGGTGQGNRVQRDRLVGAMPSRRSVTPPAPSGSTGGGTWHTNPERRPAGEWAWVGPLVGILASFMATSGGTVR